MPWCEPCDKWRAPNALLPDGTCPKCGNDVEKAALAPDDVSSEAADAKIPWHFWVMVAAATLYLGWRVVQGLMALF